jgi:hypothetical protein
MELEEWLQESALAITNFLLVGCNRAPWIEDIG